MSRRRMILAALTTTAAASALAAPPSLAAGEVTVMTRNIYLGGDIIALASAPDLATFKTNASGLLADVDATNFPVRAPALAKEIKDAGPDLVGLQEVSLWKTGPAGDPAAATTVRYDFLDLLLKALKKQGVTYTVVVKKQQFDYEAPTNNEDARLTMFDVILKRKGTKVKTGKTSSGHYKDILAVPTQAGEAKVFRGWTAVKASIDGKPFTFLNTHLEAFGGELRAKQAASLVAAGGPLANAKSPVIMLGDLNSDPAAKDAEGDAYRALVGKGLTNVFTKTVRTFGQNALLTNATPVESNSIDHILYRPKKSFTVLSREVVGTKPFQAASPRWSSDHMGVTARLRVR